MDIVPVVLVVLLTLIHLAVIARAILLEEREPYARAAWVLLLALLPVGGVLLYLLFGEPWMSSKIHRRANRVFRMLERALPVPSYSKNLEAIPDRFRNAFRTCEHVGQWPTAYGNTASIAPDSNAAIAMMIEDIDRATKTVHLSFYIWLTDHNGLKMVEAICRAAQRGVTCRIVADAIGSRQLIRSKWWAKMASSGAMLCASLKAPLGLGFLYGHRIDLRNHRKIVVIDGRVTYCGSQNCADPEFLVKKKFAPWVDIMIRYEGPIAHQNELIFVSVWTLETGEDTANFVAEQAPQPIPGGLEAIAVGTGPLSFKGAMTSIFTAVLAGAERSAVISTPYFVPDPPLVSAITDCARRGVAVRILFPHRNDSGPVGAISRAYYSALAKAGVRIFEYRGGLLHAKTLVVDEALGLVGSANMDRRSLDLNFENNVLFHSPDLAAEVGRHQDAWLADSIEISRQDLKHRSLARRFIENTLTMGGAVF